MMRRGETSVWVSRAASRRGDRVAKRENSKKRKSNDSHEPVTVFKVGARADEIRDATSWRAVAARPRRAHRPGFAGFAPRYRVRDARKKRARRRTGLAIPRSPDRWRSDLRPVPKNVTLSAREGCDAPFWLSSFLCASRRRRFEVLSLTASSYSSIFAR